MQFLRLQGMQTKMEMKNIRKKYNILLLLLAKDAIIDNRKGNTAAQKPKQ